MKRREFIAGLGAVAWPLVVRAQQPAVPVIGFLQRSAPVRNDFENFRDGLRALGYEDGQTIRIEQRSAHLDVERLRALAQELVNLNVKVLVIDGAPAIRTAMAVTKRTPIVAALITGPDQFGIQNLSRPGGNLTGLSNLADDLEGKRLELLKKLIPNARRVAVLVDSDNPHPMPSVLSRMSQGLSTSIYAPSRQPNPGRGPLSSRQWLLFSPTHYCSSRVLTSRAPPGKWLLSPLGCVCRRCMQSMNLSMRVV